jgi:hypothetical protein
MAAYAWTPEQIQRLKRMDAAGCTIEEMALAMGVNRRTIDGERARLGLVKSKGDALDAALRRAARAKAREQQKEQL